MFGFTRARPRNTLLCDWVQVRMKENFVVHEIGSLGIDVGQGFLSLLLSSLFLFFNEIDVPETKAPFHFDWVCSS